VSTYPEHEKLKAVVEQTQAAGEFLEWLRSTGREVCVINSYDEWAPCGESVERLLAGWQGIDLRRLEQEKRQLLDEQRALNAHEPARQCHPDYWTSDGYCLICGEEIERCSAARKGNNDVA
jgi:hypothetical protein